MIPRHPSGLSCVLLAFLAVLAAGSPARAQLRPLPQDQGGVGLGLALRHLPVTGRVLYVTAHPDDENNGVLVKLNRGLGLRTALLTLTRGDGGQNEIGPELFEALGVLRTEELAAVHRYDAAEQYFTRAYEFGYSFSVEETFEKWGREEILKDVVRVVRTVRPDVILTLPLEAPGGGQHHQAAARLAVEAFRAAADPERFPEQLAEGLRPWQATRVYQGGVGGGNEVAKDVVRVAFETREHDPLLGMSAHQFGMQARAHHKCQGAGQLEANPGTGKAEFVLVDSEGTRPAASMGLLEGIDTSLAGLARFADAASSAPVREGLSAIAVEADRALAAYDVRAPHHALAPIMAGLTAVRRLEETVRRLALPEASRAELLHRLRGKEADFERAAALAQGLVLEALTDDDNVTRGQSFQVIVRAFNQGAVPVRVDALTLTVPTGWAAAPAGGGAAAREVPPGGSTDQAFTVTVAPDARYSQPYWKRTTPAVDRYENEVPAHHTLPWSPPDVMAHARYTAAGETASLSRPAWWRYAGEWVGGEKQKVVNVVPALSVALSPDVAIVPITAVKPKREFRVTVKNGARAASEATVRLEAPAGWSVEPKQHQVAFRFEGELLSARFFVTPPAAVKPSEVTLRAVALQDGREFREGYAVIAYDHIQERHLFQPAVAVVKAIDVRLGAGAVIGYVQGSGDEVPAALEQLGARITFLGADDIAYGDLSRFSTIVTGIRAYQTRGDLKAYHQRLLDYVSAGGHMVVQYNKYEFNALTERPNAEGFTGSRPDPAALSPFAPYPAAVTGARVTLETAPLEMLIPGHGLFTAPNAIQAADFAGWVQERGLYFLGARDARYTELLAAEDPFPKNPGRKVGLLTEAKVGKGTWTYVGLGLWRQLPAGTAGAYRMLANLVSRARGR